MIREKLLYLIREAVTPFLENFVVEYDHSVVRIATGLENAKIRKN
jgi:hypothetical protein